MNLQQIDRELACELIKMKYEADGGMFLPTDDLEYWAYPQTFGSTSGPFGGVGGQMCTTFTIEAWVFGYFAVLFCGNKVLKVTDKWEGPLSVRL